MSNRLRFLFFWKKLKEVFSPAIQTRFRTTMHVRLRSGECLFLFYECEWNLAEHLPLRLDRLGGKYPSNTSKILQQPLLLLLLFSTPSLIFPTQGFSCFRFISLYLRLYGTTLVLTQSLFTQIGFRGCFTHRGIDFRASLFSTIFIHLLFFSSSLHCSPGQHQNERKKEEWGGGGRGSSGLYCHQKGLVVLLLQPGKLVFLSVCYLHMTTESKTNKW